MEEENKTFCVLIGPDRKEYKLDCRILQLWEKTDIIRTVYENLQSDQPIELDQKKTNKELMDLMVTYLQMHNYNPPKIVTQIKNNNLQDHLHYLDYKFIKDFKVMGDTKLSKLSDFANYMQMRPLFKLCCARIAIEMFCGKKLEKYYDLKNKLEVNKMFEANDYYQIKEKNAWIEN